MPDTQARQNGLDAYGVLPSRLGRGWGWARILLAAICVVALVACGGGNSPTVAPAASVVRPTTTPPPTLDPSHVRSGSAIIPSPTGQSASSASSVSSADASNVPGIALTPPPPGQIPATVAVPTVRTGIVLSSLPSGPTFMTADKKVTLRYPNDWDAQTAQNAAQFTPRSASPTDPNATRVTFNGLPVGLDLLTGDNAANYMQTLASQTTGRGATDLKVLSIDRVRLGSPTGLEAIRLIVSYTQGVSVISEQVIAQPPGSDTTYFLSATAPAAEFATRWSPLIDGIAGSIVFS
ncbi:MAG: hypothetical protein ACR2JW_10605 [Thermomicrobiales bacterium]